MFEDYAVSVCRRAGAQLDGRSATRWWRCARAASSRGRRNRSTATPAGAHSASTLSGRSRRTTARSARAPPRLSSPFPACRWPAFPVSPPVRTSSRTSGYDEYSRYVLRLHLALETNPDCALRVADETRAWEEGRTLIFCDAVEHEAWNRGPTTRTVLLARLQEPALPVSHPESRR